MNNALLFRSAAKTLLLLAFPFLASAQVDNYFSGYGAGSSNTTGDYNSFAGFYAGNHNTTGSYNSYLGQGAGYYNTGGYQNSAVGFQAGYANTTGFGNSLMGYRAGFSNSTGAFNSALGFQAGYSNTTGLANNFIGGYAGYGTTNGHDNSFVGYAAGFSNASGNYNSFLGNYAGYYNTASYNIFIGYYAGFRNTTGSENSFVGYQSGYNNTTGIQNSFLGTSAGYANTTGRFNSFLGYFAGRNNTTGNTNSFVGAYSGMSNTSGGWNSFLGSSTGMNNTIGGSNSFMGAFAGNANTTGSRNMLVGTYAGFSSSTGNENSFSGYYAGYNNTTGSNNTALGTYAGPSIGTLTNATAIGHRARVTASNSMVLGSINGQNGATSDTKVGIRTTAPAYTFHVNGTAAKPGGGSWTAASDARLKQEVTDFKDGMATLEKIRPVWFRYNGKAELPTEKKYVGVIAQEMQKIAPYTVGEFTYQDSTGKQEKYLDYDATALTYMLVNAAQELKSENTSLKNDLLALQNKVSQLEQLLLKKAGGIETTEGSAARLFQNEPNPTDGSTTIRFQIPVEASSAQLKVFSLSGQEVYTQELNQRGMGQIQLTGKQLAAGTYVYHLLVNGQSVDSKKLVLIR